MNKDKKKITLFDELLSQVPSGIKRYVRKQGEIAVQIGVILKKKGKTQKEFAREIGMKESQLSKILAGNANCTLKTITKIEDALSEDIITVPMFEKELNYNIAINVTLKKSYQIHISNSNKFMEIPEKTIESKETTNCSFLDNMELKQVA